MSWDAKGHEELQADLATVSATFRTADDGGAAALALLPRQVRLRCVSPGALAPRAGGRAAVWLTDRRLRAEATPERLYNANVANAVLLSFVRAACVKDVDDFCKHKSVQLAVELDAIHKLLTARGVDLAALRASASASRPQSGASRPASGSASRPPSGASTTRKGTAPSPAAGKTDTLLTFTPEQDPDGQLAVAVAKKSVFERQLEVVTSAARVVKGVGRCDESNRQQRKLTDSR